MKRIYYVLAFVVAAASFSACNPLDKTYKQLGDLPTPQAPVVAVGSITLTASDYGSLPTTDYAKTLLAYKTKADASAGIPKILDAKYPGYPDKSSVTVTYGVFNPNITLPDSVYSHVAYTVVNPTDYVAAQAVTGTTFKDYSDAQVLLFLQYKYPTPVPNQLVVLTYQYYLSGVTPSSGVLTTDSFIYLDGVWTKIYTVSAAQYASAGHSTYNQFVAGDGQATINGYLGTFLKNDPAVAATAKYGDVKYVSYNFYNSSGKVTSQRVQTLTFDGTNWVYSPIPSAPLSFVKTNGAWVADNTVTFKLTAADYTLIKTMPTTVNIQSALNNVAQYGDYNVTVPVSPTTGWTDDQVNASLVLILAHDYPNAVANQKFVVTYVAYAGSTFDVTKTFMYNGTTFVLVP